MLGGSVTFGLELDGNPHPFPWVKIIYAKDYFEPLPKISGSTISWDRNVGGRFKLYVISPFAAIGFTLKSKNRVLNALLLLLGSMLSRTYCSNINKRILDIFPN